MTLNRKGFTLIELLAVITILGILMLVAIPAISRTIENSRKDTYLALAKQYAKEVKKQWIADNIECTVSGDKIKASSATTAGDIYSVPIDTKEGDTAGDQENNQLGYTNATSLMEQGGKSSWGNKNVKGYVTVIIGTTPGTQSFYIQLIDEGSKGIVYDSSNRVLSDKLTRNNVLSKTERSFANAFQNMAFATCEVIDA